MAKIRNVSKSLASMEDLLQGKGAVTQTRGKEAVEVHRVDVPFAVDSIAEMQALDINRFTRANVYSSETVFVSYIYDPDAAEGIAPNEGSGFWQSIYCTPGLTAEEVLLLELTEGFAYTTSGRLTAGDNGHGDYLVVASGTGTNDGILYLNATNYQLKLVHGGLLRVQQGGVFSSSLMLLLKCKPSSLLVQVKRFGQKVM